LETTYVPTGELSSEKTEETSNFLTKGGRLSSTEGRFKMEERFKPSIRQETKTEIMRSLPRTAALDKKEQGTFLLIKMLRI